MNLFPTTAGILEDYNLVLEFSREAATIVDPLLIRKRFKTHIKHQTRGGDLLWGRDKWYEFDSLPRSFRTLVNEDPTGPDEALKASIELWNDIVQKAEAAMDRILHYEAASQDISKFPEIFNNVSSDELKMIHELKEARTVQANKLQAEQAEARRNALVERQRRETEANRNKRTYGDRTYHRYVLDDGTSLNQVNLIDINGLPPHKIIELMKAGANPVRFKAINYRFSAQSGTTNSDIAADNEDRMPPVKVHPIHFKRGKNF